MTTLSIIQDACTSGIALEKPTAVFGSATREHIELASLLNEAGYMIAAAHEWQTLNKIATITGDGSDETFALPTDFDRMLEKSQLWSSSLETPLTPISDRDEWLGLDVQSFDFVINAWIIYGNEVHIKPALASAVTVKYFYQSHHWAKTAALANVDQFSADTDTFRLNERLLKLAVIYKWREMKGLPYAENMADYQDLLSKLINRDKGSRIIRIGRAAMPREAIYAYPQKITG
jgi:hypothetical protein